MSSFSETTNIFQGTMSRAGKASADRYNILGQISVLKEKKLFKDVFIQESNADKYQKEIENQKDQEQFDKRGMKLKINIKKCFKDYIQKVINQTLILNQATKKRNKSRENKSSPLNNDNNSNNNDNSFDETFKSIQNNINKLKMKKIEVNKETLSPFYNKIKYKFYNLHINRLREAKKVKKLKIKREPIYKPKLDYIYSKSLSGPDWKIILGRKKNIFENHSYHVDKYYNINSNILKDTQKTFINMKKQSYRKNLIDSYETKNKNNFKLIPNVKIKILSSYKRIYNEPNISENIIQKNDTDFQMYKSFTPSVKKSRTIIDFKKSLGRYPENKHFDKRIRNSNQGIYNPNYNCVKERTKMMVLYGDKNKKFLFEKNYNENKFKGLNSTDIFSSSDAFDKFNINKTKFSLKFEKMTSRPQDKNLPCFMQGLYNRLASNLITDKSLKLNNYSNGKSYFDMYSNNLTLPKQYDKDENDLSESFNDNDYDFEDNKVNEIEEEKRTNKIKVEINKIVSKIDRLYNNYMSSKI